MMKQNMRLGVLALALVACTFASISSVHAQTQAPTQNDVNILAAFLANQTPSNPLWHKQPYLGCPGDVAWLATVSGSLLDLAAKNDTANLSLYQTQFNNVMVQWLDYQATLPTGP